MNASADQHTVDAETYTAYLANGKSKAATARAMNVGESTVRDRIKRHEARLDAIEAQVPSETPDEPVTEPEAEVEVSELDEPTPETTSDPEPEPEVTDEAEDEDEADDEPGTGSAVVDFTSLVTPEIAKNIKAILNGTLPKAITAGTPAEHVCQGDDCKVDHCVNCNWDFGHLQRKHTCGASKACAKRRATGNPELGRPHRLRKAEPVAA